VAAARAPARFSAVLALAIPHPWVRVTRPDLGAIGRSLLILGYQGPLSTPGLGPLLVRSGAVRLILRMGRGDGRFSADEVRTFDATYRVPARARATSALYRTFLTRELPAVARDRYEPGRVEVPVRLVLGAKDPVTGGPLEEHGGHLPDLTVERVPGAGHFLPEERPQLVIERALALPTP
jgi:pimeloyl-ACP methyl ester carboxylesterase